MGSVVCAEAAAAEASVIAAARTGLRRASEIISLSIGGLSEKAAEAIRLTQRCQAESV